jgi:hypothetical protein
MWRQVSAVVLVVTGIAASGLVALGLLWMRKLQPVPGADDGAAVTADLLAGLVTAGLPLREAIMVALPDELHRPRRQIGLGMAPPKAVQAIGGRDWIEIGTLLEHAAHDGAPCAGGLRHLATEMRERRRRDMEVAARKAPVLLVLPLTLCFLPAFAIVLVVPMMRGLAG